MRDGVSLSAAAASWRRALRAYSTVAIERAATTPTASMTVASRRRPHIAEEQRAHRGPDAPAPPPVDLQRDAAAQRERPDDEHERLARDEDREQPARQQLEVPADDDARDDQQAVDDRVEHRAEAAVLAGHARGDAVGVVAPGDRRRRRAPGAAPTPSSSQREPRGRPGSAPGGRSRSRSGSSTGAAARPAASPAAAGPERSRPKKRRTREPRAHGSRNLAQQRLDGLRGALAQRHGRQRLAGRGGPGPRRARPRASGGRPSGAAGSRAARRRRTSRPRPPARSS